MSEADVIKNTENPNTTESLLNDLRTLGVREGDTVLVHSAMSKIGWICGGAVSVIEALLNAVGEDGTISMPAHTGDNSDPAQWENPPVPKDWFKVIYKHTPVFEVDKTPTRGLGRIPETFRTYPNTLRSNHPQVSFCANGKNAGAITETHDLTPEFGTNSPLGHLYDLDAKVLFIGTGFANCTSFHMAETLAGNVPKKRNGTSMLLDGKRQWVWFDDFDYNDDDFEKIGKDFEKEHEVTEGKIGNAPCKLFSIRDGIDFATEWIRQNRK